MQPALLVGMGLVLVGGVVAPVVTPTGPNTALAASRAVLPFDFDGDGYADLAVGVPGEDLRGVKDAGAVQVLYGSGAGVTARDQLWHQGTEGVKGTLEKRDGFGAVLASGDFDADGYADLAVGIPGEDIRSIRDAGAVEVLYGGPRRLTARDQAWHQGKPGVPGKNGTGDRFGDSLAAGDFDADGYADLAIGVHGDSRVVVLRGSPGGLTSSGVQSWKQGKNGIASQPRGGEGFGRDLAAGDVNGDGHDDLAILVYAEFDTPYGLEGWSSAVHVLLGSPTGLTAAAAQYFLATDLVDPTEETIRFKMAFADFNHDGRADLALAGGGIVAVLQGNPDGVHAARLPEASTPGLDSWWSVAGRAEGLALGVAAGDFTGDGNPDLVMEGGLEAVQVILGTATGLSTSVGRWAIPAAEYTTVAVLPLSGGSHAWVVATNIPRRTPEPMDYTGAVTVLRGEPDGTAGPFTVWSQDSPGIKGAAEPWDSFGVTIGPSSRSA